MQLRSVVNGLRGLLQEGSYKDWVVGLLRGKKDDGGGPESDHRPSKDPAATPKVPAGKPADAGKPPKSSLRELPFKPTEGPDAGKEDPSKVCVRGKTHDVAAFLTATGLKPLNLIKLGSGDQIAVLSRKDYDTADFGTFGKPEAEKSFKASKWTSAGGVVLFGATEEGLRKILLVAPKGKYGGYSWTFPKGRVDEGENLVKTAKREVREETGIEASLLPNGYLGVAEGTSSFTHYYMMVRVSGEPGAGTDGESEKVEWVGWAEAFKRVRGSGRDKQILLKAWDYTRKMRKSLR